MSLLSRVCPLVRNGTFLNQPLARSLASESQRSYAKGIVAKETAMLSKCANPSCSASFRYFHQGKLFRIETQPFKDDQASGVPASKTSSKTEFFWLCDNCARAMTLEYDHEFGVIVRRVDSDLRAAS